MNTKGGNGNIPAIVGVFRNTPLPTEIRHTFQIYTDQPNPFFNIALVRDGPIVGYGKQAIKRKGSML